MIKKFVYFSLSFFILSSSTPLYAFNYDNDVLEIFSKLIPRIVLMSERKNNVQNKIQLCLVSDKNDDNSAAMLAEKIKSNYPDGIGNIKIKTIGTSFMNVGSCKNSQLVFLFDTNEQNIDHAVKFANENMILTMSYDARYLENGVATSLFLGRKVIPYININVIRKNKIGMDSVLLRISKIYSDGDDR